MSFSKIFALLLSVIISKPILAADAESIEAAIELLKAACVSGESLEIKADGDGGISLLKKGMQGKLYFSKKHVRGVVESLQGELQRDDLREQRECMRPKIDKILDAILGLKSEDNIRLNGFSLEDENALRSRLKTIGVSSADISLLNSAFAGGKNVSIKVAYSNNNTYEANFAVPTNSTAIAIARQIEGHARKEQP